MPIIASEMWWAFNTYWPNELIWAVADDLGKEARKTYARNSVVKQHNYSLRKKKYAIPNILSPHSSAIELVPLSGTLVVSTHTLYSQ